VGYPHDIKGNALYSFVILQDGVEGSPELEAEIKNGVARLIGAIAKPDKIQFVSGLPKTRSGKIMRRILRKIASDETEFGDTSTLLDPEIVTIIQKGKI